MSDNKEPTDIVAEIKADITIEAAEGDKQPTFKINAYNGGPLNVGGFYLPVVPDLEGGSLASENIPILLGHDRQAIVGRSTKVNIGSDGILIEGVITGDVSEPGPARQVVTHAKNGFTWQASIGATVKRRETIEKGSTINVNGRDVIGPAIIAREWELYETSILSVGADKSTAVEIAAKQKQEEVNTVEENKNIEAGQLGADDIQAQLKADIEAARKEAATEARRIAEVSRIVAKAGVSHGVDDEGNKIEDIAAHAIEAGLSPAQAELYCLRASRVDAPAIRTSEKKADSRILEAALCLSSGVSEEAVAKTIKASDRDSVMEAALGVEYRGMSLHGLMGATIQAAGKHYHGQFKSDNFVRSAFEASQILEASGTTTYSLPGILSNVANKHLYDGFSKVNSTLDRVARVVSNGDFKASKTYSLLINGLEEVVGVDVPHATVSERGNDNQVKQHALQVAVSRVDLINDDLGAFSRTSTALGRGAARGKEEAGWQIFNAAIAAQFTTAIGNEVTGGLDVSGLGLAEAALLGREIDGHKVLATPHLLLVPAALGPAAKQMFVSTTVNETTSAGKGKGVANPYVGSFEPVICPYLGSATTYYLLADPADIAVLEIAYLSGNRMPVVSSADMQIGKLGMTFQVVYDFGVAFADNAGGVEVVAG